MADDTMRREFACREFIRRGEGVSRAPYRPELSFYNTVKAGDVEAVRRLCGEDFAQKEGFGCLSDDPLQNLRYHFAITAAILARTCIDGGMELSLAYSLSDYFIRRVDTAADAASVSALHTAMCLDYAERMKQLRRENVVSRHVITCIDYIDEHLHTRITLDRLSVLTGLSRSYLSRLFRQETGRCVSGYILDKKLETAESMLAFSDYSTAEIAGLLAFPSQSYFTEVFRRRTGLTPLQFRNSRSRSDGT